MNRAVAPYLNEQNGMKVNNFNVLLLDDDPVCLSVVSKMMRESGYKGIHYLYMYMLQSF